MVSRLLTALHHYYQTFALLLKMYRTQIPLCVPKQTGAALVEGVLGARQTRMQSITRKIRRCQRKVRRNVRRNFFVKENRHVRLRIPVSASSCQTKARNFLYSAPEMVGVRFF